MIPHGEGFVIRHESGRYFNSDCHFPGFAAGAPAADMPAIVSIYRLVDSPLEAELVRTRPFCGRFLSHPEWELVADQFEVVPVPGCGCCGTSYHRSGPIRIWSDGTVHRCEKHRARNLCLVEGCRRTGAASGQEADDR